MHTFENNEERHSRVYGTFQFPGLTSGMLVMLAIFPPSQVRNEIPACRLQNQQSGILVILTTSNIVCSHDIVAWSKWNDRISSVPCFVWHFNQNHVPTNCKYYETTCSGSLGIWSNFFSKSEFWYVIVCLQGFRIGIIWLLFTPGFQARTYKAPINIEWVPPPILPSTHPSKSGDRGTLPQVDLSRPQFKFSRHNPRVLFTDREE